MDLNLISLARRDGQEQPNPQGLFVPAPPKHSARSRQPDHLALFFVLEGGPPLDRKQQDQLLASLAQSYYKTPGTVTSALRSVADKLNEVLLERNLQASGSRQGTGLLAAVALRGDALFLALSGPMHGFLIESKGVQHWQDLDVATRGLGLGRAVPIQYHQASLSPNDKLILTPQPPANWSETTLAGLHGQGPEGLRRRLLGQSGPDFSGILFQAKSGPGQIHLLQPQPQAGLPVTAESPTQVLIEEESELPRAISASSPPVYPEPLESAPVEYVPQIEAHPTLQPPSQPALEKQARKRPAGKLFAAFGLWMGGLSRGSRSLAQRMLPGEGTLPPSVMAFFAIAVPLVVVTIATVVYFQRGRTSQYQTFYAQAVQAAGQAQGQTDPQARRTAWGLVIANLDKAEAYGTTPESEALRSQAQIVFDELEGIQRISYEPAIAGGVPASYQIKRLVATDSDLYLLDASTGTAARAVPAGQVYELDDQFQCGPGLPAGQVTGPLIDIAAIPKGDELKATLLAMDAQGNLLQCIPGSEPVFTALALPPTGWGEPQAFNYDQGNLYVLDPAKNAVWVYWGSDFTAQPQFFFSEDVPPLEDVIDLAVDKSDLYLLHADGHVTLCTFSELGVSPTRCTDPLPYVDSRPGREGLLLIPEAPFTQIQATQPPDPSLYLLESQSQAIYHFSLRLLTFQRQLRSQKPLPADSPATGFAIRPDGRVAFLALGNKVYYGGIP